MFKKLTLNNITYCIIGFVAIYVAYLCIAYIYTELFSTKILMSCTGKEHKYYKCIGHDLEGYDEVKDKTIPLEIIIRHFPFQDQGVTIRTNDDYLPAYAAYADNNAVNGINDTTNETINFDRITKVIKHTKDSSIISSEFEGHCVPAKRD